ncbi:hypothetical protein ACIPF8_19045 [Collimonas sp. NPDC087041]|uniref:hypothetical protein n=1 Tax=Collimonas sp. NPDC087041 TaxID=3363960 RepID=UPI003809EEF1
MALDEINWELDADRKSILFTISTNPPMAFKLNGSQVDEMLRNLGDLRALMTDQHSSRWPFGQTFEAVPHPAWSSEPEVQKGNSILHIRDPRYGWLHYVIPREHARQLGGILSTQAEAPASEPGPLQLN